MEERFINDQDKTMIAIVIDSLKYSKAHVSKKGKKRQDKTIEKLIKKRSPEDEALYKQHEEDIGSLKDIFPNKKERTIFKSLKVTNFKQEEALNMLLGLEGELSDSEADDEEDEVKGVNIPGKTNGQAQEEDEDEDEDGEEEDEEDDPLYKIAPNEKSRFVQLISSSDEKQIKK